MQGTVTGVPLQWQTEHCALYSVAGMDPKSHNLYLNPSTTTYLSHVTLPQFPHLKKEIIMLLTSQGWHEN